MASMALFWNKNFSKDGSASKVASFLVGQPYVCGSLPVHVQLLLQFILETMKIKRKAEEKREWLASKAVNKVKTDSFVPRLPIRKDKIWSKSHLKPAQVTTAATSDDNDSSDPEEEPENEQSTDVFDLFANVYSGASSTSLFEGLGEVCDEEAFSDDDDDDNNNNNKKPDAIGFNAKSQEKVESVDEDDAYQEELDDEDATMSPLKGMNADKLSRANDKEAKKKAAADNPFNDLFQGNKHLSLDEKKIIIGTAAAHVIENPIDKMSNLRKLLNVIIQPQRTKDIEVIKVALISLVAVFEDIIPEYSIRPITENELKVRVSKDVKAQREYEFNLVLYYKNFVRFFYFMLMPPKHRSALASQISKWSRHVPFSLRLVCISVIFKLYSRLSHFNYAYDIISMISFCVCPVHSGPGELKSDLSAAEKEALMLHAGNALAQVFKEDNKGFKTVQLLKVLSGAANLKHYQVSIHLLNPLLSIRASNLLPSLSMNARKLRTERTVMDKKLKKLQDKKKPHVSKKAKKEQKIDKLRQHDIDEASAVENRDQVVTWHRDALRYLFRIYIGVIKKHPMPKLLGPVFQGFLQFSSMINEDYFDDLLICLKSILPNILDHVDTSVLCIAAVFTILQHQGLSLQLDLHYYYKIFYSLLLNIPNERPFLALELHPVYSTSGSFSQTKRKDVVKKRSVLETWVPPKSHLVDGNDVGGVWKSIGQCIQLMFLKEQQVPLNRVGAMIHRLIWLSFSLDSGHLSYCLGIVYALLKCYPRTLTLLSADDEDLYGNGTFNPMAEDPDIANPFSYSLCPMIMLLQEKHEDAQVRARIKELLELYQARQKQ